MKNTNGNDKLKREKNASRNRVHTTVQENDTNSGRVEKREKKQWHQQQH